MVDEELWRQEFLFLLYYTFSFFPFCVQELTSRWFFSIWRTLCGVCVNVLKTWWGPSLMQPLPKLLLHQTGRTKYTACVSISWQSSSSPQHRCLCFTSMNKYNVYFCNLDLRKCDVARFDIVETWTNCIIST